MYPEVLTPGLFTCILRCFPLYTLYLYPEVLASVGYSDATATGHKPPVIPPRDVRIWGTLQQD
jgi:hypothetical protein